MSNCRSNYPPAKRIVTASLGVLLGLSSVNVCMPVQAYAGTSEGVLTGSPDVHGVYDTFRFYSSDSQGTVLSGAIYEFVQDGRVVKSVTSTTDEYVEVALPHGNYTIRLASPPQSFKETSNTVSADTSSLDANHKATYQIKTVFVKSEKLSNLPLSGDHGHSAGDSDSHVPVEGPKDNSDAETSMTETHTVEEIAPITKGRDRYYQIHLVDEDGEPLENITVQATVEEAFSFLDKDGTQKTYNKGDVIEFTSRADGYSDKLFVGSKELPAQEGTTNITSEVMPKLSFSAENFTFSPGLFGVDPTLGGFEDPDTAPILWTWEGRRATPIVYTYKPDPNLEVGKSRTVDDEETIYVGTKPTTEHVTIPHETLEPKQGYTIVSGKDGSKDVVTTYTVDPNTGELTPQKHDENVVPAVPDTYKEIVYTYKGDPELEVGKSRTVEEEGTIYVGIKPTTEHVTIPHETLEPKQGYTIVPGKDGSKDVVTTYEVNPDTGATTPHKHDENVVPAVPDTYKEIVYTYKGDPELEVGKSRTVDEEKTIYVGTKPTRERVTIPHETLEPKQGYTIVPGKDGSKDVVTTYEVNPDTGATTPHKHDENVVPAVDDSYQKQEDTTSEKPEQPNSASTSEDTAKQDSSTDAHAETNSEGTPSDTNDSPDTSEDSKATPTTSGQGQKLPQTGAGILAQVLNVLGSAGVGFGVWRYRKNLKHKSDS